MSTPTQWQRFRRLLDYLDRHFRRAPDVTDVETVSCYSYRQINRIFETRQRETIGQYVKRLRLEKGAQALKFSSATVSDIAAGVGYGDVAAFSKAFHRHFGQAPTVFRQARQDGRGRPSATHAGSADTSGTPAAAADNIGQSAYSDEALTFDIVQLPDLEVIAIEHRGPYDDYAAIDNVWHTLEWFAHARELVDDNTWWLAEIHDDDDITGARQCRYTAALAVVLPADLSRDWPADSVVRRQRIGGGWFARFDHHGSPANTAETHARILAEWAGYDGLECADRPTLEMYLGDDSRLPEHEQRTAIFVPIETPLVD